jgi:cyanate permease
MALYMFLFGLGASLVMSLSPKVTAMWFSDRLVLTNALIWIAMYVGQMMGAMFSATTFSPLLGGWRNVLYAIGIPAILIGILWMAVKSPAKQHEEGPVHSEPLGLRQTLLHVMRIRDVWLVALMFMTQMGALNATNGYIPLFLRNLGWNGASADGVLTLSLGMGCIGTIPLVMLSNRLKARKLFLFLGILLLSLGIGSLMFVRDTGIWIVLSITGLIRAVAPVILNTVLIETKGVGSKYAGTAFGIMTGCGLLAAFVFPPVGNSLAAINPGLPFVFWGAMGVLCLISLRFLGRPQRSAAA